MSHNYPTAFGVFRYYARTMLKDEGYPHPPKLFLAKIWSSMSLKERDPWKLMAMKLRERSDSRSISAEQSDLEEITARLHQVVISPFVPGVGVGLGSTSFTRRRDAVKKRRQIPSNRQVLSREDRSPYSRSLPEEPRGGGPSFKEVGKRIVRSHIPAPLSLDRPTKVVSALNEDDPI